MGGRVRREHMPPVDPDEPRLRVRRLRLNPITGIIVSTSSEGLLTHWADGRSRPCLDVDCPGCEQGISTRWLGYIQCQSQAGQAQRSWLLQLTEGGWLSLRGQTEQGESWRGLVFRCYRAAGPVLRAEQVIHVVSPVRVADGDLATPVDLAVQIDRIWRVADPRRQGSAAEKGDLL